MQTGNPGWATVLQWSLWAVVMAAIMGWVARSRSRPLSDGAADRVAQPTSLLIIGIVAFLFFAALAVVSNAFANETTTWWTTATFVGFACLGLWLIGSYFAERHDISDAGMYHRRLVGKARRFAWADVALVTYSPGMKWFRLELDSGQVVRVSAMSVNLPAFARLLREHATAARVDPETRTVLEQTEAGNPPSVWS